MRSIEKASIYYVNDYVGARESKMGYTIVKQGDYVRVLTFLKTQYIREKILFPDTMPETIHIPYTNANSVMRKQGEYDFELVTLGKITLANGDCRFVYPDGMTHFHAKVADESMNDAVFTAMTYFGAAMRFGGIR